MMTTGAFNGEIRMLPNVGRVYVCQKSQVTEYIERNLHAGHVVYRTSLVCECADRQNVRHSGAVIINSVGIVVDYVIRCKGCFNRVTEKEADNGTV